MESNNNARKEIEEKKVDKSESKDKEETEDIEGGGDEDTTNGGGGGGSGAGGKFWSKRKRGVASSGLGKALIEQNLDKESKTLINTICDMLVHTHDKKISSRVRRYIFKIAAKTVLLLQDGIITSEQFNSLKIYFRRICSSIRNGYLVTKCLTPESADRTASVILVFGTGIKDTVMPHLSKETMDKFDFVLSIFGDPQFLLQASTLENFDSVAMVLAFYLQETATA